jgi:hypothetical protein
VITHHPRWRAHFMVMMGKSGTIRGFIDPKILRGTNIE